MKDLTFLKENYFVNKGIYNNQDIFENTLESYNLAIKEKKGIVINCFLTKDDQIICYDEYNLARLLNLKDEVKDTTYDELLYLCNYHIPLLEEALKFINGRVPIIINPKVFNNKYFLLKEMSKLLDSYNGQFAIINNNAIVIKWFNKNKPLYITGEALTKKKYNLKTLENNLAHYAINPDFKSVNIMYYDSADLIKLKQTSSIIMGYLINSQDKYRTYKDSFDNLIIDNFFNLNF